MTEIVANRRSMMIFKRTKGKVHEKSYLGGLGHRIIFNVYDIGLFIQSTNIVLFCKEMNKLFIIVMFSY